MFGMYSSNWTEMNLKFKKLLSLSIIADSANESTIKITPKKIVNLQLYTSVIIFNFHLSKRIKCTTCINFNFQVIMTSYNILSVMLKSRSKGIKVD